MSAFLFGTEPIEAWRLFNWGSCDEPREMMMVASKAPPGVNPFEFGARRRLHSIGTHSVWVERQPTEAECPREEHRAPGSRCGCGLWGVKDRAYAESMAWSYNAPLIAKVRLWGRFVEHGKGWRAQFGYPIEMFLNSAAREPEWCEEIAETIRVNYGVPVTVAPFPNEPPSTIDERKVLFASSGISAWSSAVMPAAPPRRRPVWPSKIVPPSQLWNTLTVKPSMGVYRWH